MADLGFSTERGVRMKIGIIADDLTGANDSGVQLSRAGLRTTVRFDLSNSQSPEEDVLVLDTDSRSLRREEAYKRVKEAALFLKQAAVDVIYKKVDSTLRGNLGIEIDAVYDVFQPDFVVIAPGYPKNGRTVESGHLYLHGKRVNETEISRDPKCPVTESYVPKLLELQSERTIGHLPQDVLSGDYADLKLKLDDFRQQGVPYLLFDSTSEADLQFIASALVQSGYSVIWVGSAGLANYLPHVYHLEKKRSVVQIPRNEEPVLLVVGSVTSVTRRQLDHFLHLEGVCGIELPSTELVSAGKRKETAITVALNEALEAYRGGQHIALYSAGDEQAIKAAQEAGAKRGYSPTDVSNLIVLAIGELVFRLLSQVSFSGLILTGGDTAKQVCTQLGVSGIQLFDEIEVGVPVGRLMGQHTSYAVTKAGAFGTERTFERAMKFLQGVDG